MAARGGQERGVANETCRDRAGAIKKQVNKRLSNEWPNMKSGWMCEGAENFFYLGRQ